MPQAEVHISSAVVHARPERLSEVQAAVSAIEGAEIHAAAETGKLVVTFETASERDLARHLETIQTMPGVLAATLVYHQVETGALD